ncbi:hypothetical protein SAMN02745245_01095 [Anaerosphaera aminiphila DSM 21120]|uniref:Uncharacterized protein n=1 Tax=Anaerosphaera aminiphila DSM 21120 TaxID=1120995 RepID=A0A1M5S2U4_9FIRM|nr:hypothetical protein [Anaerosphaera aminiphila]SHH32804.1 hypothetical protein SAMN02745245_01095 [Anaerosphaera aminiphila DSM 21120]
MKNNVRGLVFHLFVIIIVFLISLLINLNETVVKVVYGNIVFKVILSLFIIILYYNFGKAMSKRSSRKLDFFTGNIIFCIAIVLFMFAFVGLGADLFKFEVSGSMWKFPLDLFLMPELYIYQMFNIGYNIFSIFFAAIIPGIIYGISIKRSRAKILKKKRLMKQRQNRRR